MTKKTRTEKHETLFKQIDDDMAPSNFKRGYCIDCLRELGISFEEFQLRALEKFGLFPHRVAPSMWDADQIDEWLRRRDGSKPTPPICH